MRARHVTPLLLFPVLVLLALPRVARTAPATPRWLADSQLLAPLRTLDPSAGIQTFNQIAAMDIVDRSNAWAATTLGIMHWDGMRWFLVHPVSSSATYTAVSMANAADGWAVGSTAFYDGRSAPYSTPLLSHYNGSQWNNSAIVGPGGTSPRGEVTDVKALPGPSGSATAWGVGYQQQNASTAKRPLIVYYDGAEWHDRTPQQWQYGSLSKLSMISATEGWAAGVFSDTFTPNTFTPGRAVLLHLKDGVWAQEQLPSFTTGALQFDPLSLIMHADGEGWASLKQVAPCATGVLLHRVNGVWQLTPQSAHHFNPIVLALISGTNRGWATLFGNCYSGGLIQPAERLRFDGGTFTPDTAGAQFIPTTYALFDDQTQLAAANGSFMRYTRDEVPTDPVAPNNTHGRYFRETGHTLAGPFQAYYESHGLDLGDPGISPRESLALFGYPVSEPFMETNPDTREYLQVQYFERARFEYHPANPDPYKVLLGRLGFTTLLRRRPGDLASRPPDPGTVDPGCQRFTETGIQLCPPFRAFWNAQGGLPAFGFPIANVRDETSTTDANHYQTLWFERERLEYHAELKGTPYEVLLGLLAAEDLHARGYLP